MFDTLSDRLSAVFSGLRSKGRLSEEDIDATAREIRRALLEADVALPVVKQFITRLKDRARDAEVNRALNPAQQVIKIVNEELVAILGGPTRLINYAKTPPTVIMLCGLQGAGKTTLAGKLGLWLRTQGHAPLLVACDLQRPNAVQQLQVVGGQAGVEVYAPQPGSGVGDPLAVAADSLELARRRGFDVVVIDTAGRLGIDAELMAQAADIRRITSPDEVFFVVDAMIGQDAVTTAQAFGEGVGFTGVVLTKLDGDARGGAALSIATMTGAPITFASNGEKLADFDVFHPERMASRILGMGDVLTLIEQAERTFEADEAEQMASRIGARDFSLEDFLAQLQMVRRMGPIGNLLGMLPGGKAIKDQLANVDEREFDRVAAIIHGMTPAERRDPKIIDGSRRRRIADGSGVSVSDVNSLVDRFFEARKMMTQLTGGMGMGGGGARRPARKSAKKGKSRRGPTPRARDPRPQPALPGASDLAAPDPGTGFDPAAFDPATFDPSALDPAVLAKLSRRLGGGVNPFGLPRGTGPSAPPPRG